MADLTAQQNQALTLLITGRSIPEIAQELGLHRSTVWRWSREPAFEAEFNASVAEARSEQVRSYLSMQEKALETLTNCLESRNDMVRLRASLIVLDRVDKIKYGPVDADEIVRRRTPIPGWDNVMQDVGINV